MKRAILASLLILALVVGGGCSVPAEYVEADQKTYDVVAPRYTKYVEADPVLTKEEKERALRTVATWKLRIDKNK